MSDETRRLVRSGLDQWQIEYSHEQISKLLAYRDLLVDWNARINLTRLISPHDVAVEHFLDSISLLTVVGIPQEARLLDIGAGAGFPSLPIKIMRPDIKVTLLEATAKKLDFCRAVVKALDLTDVQLIHERAETKTAELARGFDVVTARAVAHLDKLLTWCEPYVEPTRGIIAAFKGARAHQEADDAAPTIKRLKLRVEVKDLDIPGSDRSHAVVICGKLKADAW